MNNLDSEEYDLLASFENDEWTSIRGVSEARAVYAEYAKASTKKEKRINIRISERDLEELQRKAVHSGLPYQTLISSILHQYVNGTIKPV